MSQSLRQSNFKRAPDAAIRCRRPLAKVSMSYRMPEGSQKFCFANPRDSKFGNIIVGALGTVSARTRLLVPSPIACMVVTFVQQLESSTQFMSIISVADIEINSRFEIGNLLHAC